MPTSRGVSGEKFDQEQERQDLLSGSEGEEERNDMLNSALPLLHRNVLQQRFKFLRWMVPLGMMLLVIFYQLGPARWIHEQFGYPYHIVAEIIVFAALGPTLAWFLLYLLERWLEERDTSDLQAQLLKRARQEARRSRQLNDDALQVLFAAGAVIDSLKETHPGLSPENLDQVESTEEALQESVESLRSHLLKRE